MATKKKTGKKKAGKASSKGKAGGKKKLGKKKRIKRPLKAGIGPPVPGDEPGW
jgi:hypothetical protein